LPHAAGPDAAAFAVSLERIARRFGARWALRGVTLTVDRGAVVGLMGHNGSGKSTLLRVLCTVLRPSAGDGWVFGHHLVRDAVRVRAAVGFLAHSPGLYEDLSATENLRFAAAMFGGDDARIEPVLERVGLWRERNERVRGFSAGMQRRLALARLVLGDPQLLLLDEPYNNLDTEGIALVNDVVGDTRARGGAALIVVHDRRQGESVIDRVVELHRGAVRGDEGAVPGPAPATRATPLPATGPR
jgi:heme exporter protein A